MTRSIGRSVCLQRVVPLLDGRGGEILLVLDVYPQTNKCSDSGALLKSNVRKEYKAEIIS